MLSNKYVKSTHLIHGFFPVIYSDSKLDIIKSLKLEKIMVNIAYLNSNQKKKNIHDVLNFDGKVFLDSGVFQRGFYRKNFTEEEIKQYRVRLLTWYNSLKPDVASSLDLPVPFPSNPEEKRRRINWTIENYKIMNVFSTNRI